MPAIATPFNEDGHLDLDVLRILRRPILLLQESGIAIVRDTLEELGRL